MGFRTIAIARGKDKEEMVTKLGAIHYIDSQSQNVVEELVKLGGAKVILATLPSGKAMSAALRWFVCKWEAYHDRGFKRHS